MKRLFALLLVFLMIYSLTACNTTVKEPADPSASDSGETSQATGNVTIFEDVPVTKPPTKTVYYWTQKKMQSGATTTIYSRTYDPKGNLLTDACQVNKVTSYSYAYTYDTKGNCLTETCEDQYKGKWSVAYFYDDSGKLTKLIHFPTLFTRVAGKVYALAFHLIFFVTVRAFV